MIGGSGVVFSAVEDVSQDEPGTDTDSRARRQVTASAVRRRLGEVRLGEVEHPVAEFLALLVGLLFDLAASDLGLFLELIAGSRANVILYFASDGASRVAYHATDLGQETR